MTYDYNSKILRMLTDNLPDMLWIKDVEGRYMFANKALCDNLLMARDLMEPIGKTDLFFAERERTEHAERDDWHTFGELCIDSDKEVLDLDQPMRFEEYGNVRGELLYLEVHKAPFCDEAGNVLGTVGSGRDITEQVLLKQKLQEQARHLDHQAHHDALTDLPNRTLFQDRLEQMIRRAQRDNTRFALIFIDLDHFKKINDSLGHDVGDRIIQVIGQRLKGMLHHEYTLARVGGDEFTVLVEDFTSVQTVSHLARRLIAEIKEPMEVDTHVLYVSSSIGISVYPQDSTIAGDLLKYADSAMYKAKEEGRDNYQFYTEEMTRQAFERVMMETSLRHALDNEEFVVHYQPKYDCEGEKVVGMEALIRWLHPSLGLIAPSRFIRIAEETGLIVPLDRWVMKRAMVHYVNWYDDGLKPGILSLNLSMKQLEHPDFLDMLEEEMRRSGFNPHWLEMEITESQVMKNPERSISVLRKLNDLGIRLAIDDFGTGYSSLAYLKRLPVHTLKIDKSFISDLPHDEEDAAIVNAVIALARSLKLDVIAEGVENAAQKAFLQTQGCEAFQGFHFSRPLPAAAIEELLEEFREGE